MPETKKQRTSKASLWKELLLRRPIVLLSVVIAFTSAATFVWDEIVAPVLPSGSERRKLLDAIFLLPWYGWIIVGLLVLIFLVGAHAYTLIYSAEEQLEQAAKAFQATPPSVRPYGYGQAADQTSYGLTVTNGGYLAFDIHIPPVLLEPSMYTLTFPETVPQLGERDHKRFLAGYLEHETKPGLDGGCLHEMMRTDNVDVLRFSIIYKDGSATPVWYKSNCAILRDSGVRNGLRVRYLTTEVIPEPVMP